MESFIHDFESFVCYQEFPLIWMKSIFSQNQDRNFGFIFKQIWQLRLEYLPTNLAKSACQFINEVYKSIVGYPLEDMNFAIIASLTLKRFEIYVRFLFLYGIFYLRRSLVGFRITFCFSYSAIEVWNVKSTSNMERE